MVYFASGAKETGHLAKVVARQRTSKKTGRPHLVNTQMRVKPAAPLVLNGKKTIQKLGPVQGCPSQHIHNEFVLIS